jgi:2,4'-dihydroxyacetophenone dioxygenase
MTQYSMCNLIKELNNQVDLENDKRWMQSHEGIQTLPVLLNVSEGSWVILVKVKANTTMAQHYHASPMYVFTVYGHWHYLEYDWEATTGHFLCEMPGEFHTPHFIEDTLLYSVVSGPIIYPKEDSDEVIVTDVYTHVNSVKKHYAEVGIGEDELNKILR